MILLMANDGKNMRMSVLCFDVPCIMSGTDSSGVCLHNRGCILHLTHSQLIQYFSCLILLF